MRKRISFFIISIMFMSGAIAATNYKRFNTITSHDDVPPYTLNNTKLSSPTTARAAKSGTTTSRATGSVATSAVPITTNTTRNVVQRKTNIARSATKNSANTMMSANTGTRNVVARTNTTRSVTPARTTANTRTTNIITNNYTTPYVSSERCMADYKECMESYCLREDTAYNRCYCSAKLAQIDSKYQDKIDSLIQQIIKLQYSVDVTDAEIKEYWDNTVGMYTGTNPWVNIDNALNIEWPDNESRIRGQNAFNTGHNYCVQHLNACYYMATNMRDAYKSEIARDCAAYEKSLQQIQAAAESVIESYGN